MTQRRLRPRPATARAVERATLHFVTRRAAAYSLSGARIALTELAHTSDGGLYGRFDPADRGPQEGQEAHVRHREDDRARSEDPRGALHQAGERAHDPRADRGAD